MRERERERGVEGERERVVRVCGLMVLDARKKSEAPPAPRGGPDISQNWEQRSLRLRNARARTATQSEDLHERREKEREREREEKRGIERGGEEKREREREK